MSLYTFILSGWVLGIATEVAMPTVVWFLGIATEVAMPTKKPCTRFCANKVFYKKCVIIIR